MSGDGQESLGFEVPTLSRNAPAAASEARRRVEEHLRARYPARWSRFVLDDESRQAVKWEADCDRDPWPDFMLWPRRAGAPLQVLALAVVARTEVNDRPSAGWRVQADRLRLLAALDGELAPLRGDAHIVRVAFVTQQVRAVLLADAVITEAREGHSTHAALSETGMRPLEALA